MSTDSNWKAKYPRNWKKVSKTIRRIAGYRCESCGKQEYNGLSVHHLGIPYINSDMPSDKHDLRRENLISLCCACHNAIDNIVCISRKIKKKKRKRRERLERHRALGIGVGLVCLMEGA